MMMIGSLALMGFPFLTGFYSKDVILEVAYGSYSIKGHFAHWLGSISAFFTAFYSLRLISLTFLRPTNGLKQIVSHVHEAPFLMAFPLCALAFGSIFIGYVTKDMMIGPGTDFWGNALFTLPEQLSMLDAEWIDTSVKLVPLVLSLSGAASAFLLYSYGFDFLYKLKTSSVGRRFYVFLNRKWLFDKVYNELLTQTTLSIGYKHMYQNMDRGVIELLGPNGIATSIYARSSALRRVETGFIFHYVFSILLGLVLILTPFGLWNFFFVWVDFRLVILVLLSFWFVYPYHNK
jgi:NADH-ubiquinone oxidoreductase chain 5